MDYLQPGFDPSSVTVAKLRNILNSHNVLYPSSAKKSELVEIFQDEIAPKASTLLAEYNARIGNSHDHGFLNATDNDEEADEREDKLTPRGDKKTKKSSTAEPTPEKSKINTDHAKVVKPKVKKESKNKDDKVSTRRNKKRVEKEEQREKESEIKTEEHTEHETSKAEDESEIDDSESDATENLSSFSDQNVFQSRKESSKPSRKRKLNNKDDEESAKRLKSPTATSNKSRITKSPSKSIFDDSDSDILNYSSLDKKEHDKSFSQEKQAKDLTTQSPRTPSTKPNKALPVSTTQQKSFNSLQEEMDNFDKQLNIVKQRHSSNTPIKTEKDAKSKSRRTTQSPTVDNDLAKSLGITIQGFQPPVVPAQLQQVNQNVNSGDDAASVGNSQGLYNLQSEQRNGSAQELSSNVRSTSRDFTPTRAIMVDDQGEGKSTKTPTSTSSKKKKKTSQTPSKHTTPVPKATPKSSESSRRSVTPKSAKKTPRIRTPLGKLALTPKPRLLSLNSTQNISDSDDDDDEEKREVEEEEQKSTIDNSQADVEHSIEYTDGLFSVSTAITFVTWISVILSALFGYWYYEQKYLVGYCGQEIDQPTFEDSSVTLIEKLGNVLDTYCKPSCVPCPPHARCFTNLELGCFEDFMEHKPWYDFVLPGHKKCVPDTKKAEKLEIMIDVALDLLRSRNAAVECGVGSDDVKSGISVQELHDLLLSMKAPYITTEEFEELWSRSIVELKKEPDITLRQIRLADLPPGQSPSNTNNSEGKVQDKIEILRSTSLSNISLKCQIRSSIMGNISRYKYWILTLVLSVIAFKAIQFKFRRHQLEKIKIDILYQEVLDKLANQARIASENSSINRYIGANQLRDLILSSEDDLSERVRLWNFVGNKVEHNTNVVSRITENHGEIMKVWEWISDENR
ncbi:hypothetical protein KGF57_001745 [Candida theae]|uniref:Inner nuclear membrane protein SRC1 n=1 Tax=Candida theae TaxID=1198502 RepID=A0AAD5FZD5_9ASCO|nr:uncharacterized protein KGF57_001745 [Candida theae]KAI5961322.1 hypothetical protein KGF57_001745 [Candida theae]